MEETEAKQSWTVHYTVNGSPNYLTDPDAWCLIAKPNKVYEVEMNNSDNSMIVRGWLDSHADQSHRPITMASTGVNKEEHDKALSRIKELEADKEFLERANSANWSRLIQAKKGSGELEEKNKSLLALNTGMFNESALPDSYKLTAHIQRIKKLEETIRDLEARNKSHIEASMNLRQRFDSLSLTSNPPTMLDGWEEEYGWTQHIFDSLDNNPLLGCKKWLP